MAINGYAGPLPTFQGFKKIPRLNRDIVITEKIDGTNGVVFISEDGMVLAGSKNRWLFPGKSTDNAGFAEWVATNSEALRDTLGPGFHYGEWFGRKIGRGYGMQDRKFALFNTDRWKDLLETDFGLTRVPILYEGRFSQYAVESALQDLRAFGSVAVEEYSSPEGVIIYHVAAGQYFKVLLEGDELPKGLITRQEQENVGQRQ